VSGYRRYPEAGADVKARACWKAHHPGGGQVRVLLRGARRPLVASEIHPNPITHGNIHYALPDCVDDTGTVLVRRHLRKRRRPAIAGTKPRLPVGGVDTGDGDADTDLARPRFSHIAIHEVENRRVTGM
jgi:hypothetical protein